MYMFEVLHLPWNTDGNAAFEEFPATARGRGQVDIRQLAKPEPASLPNTLQAQPGESTKSDSADSLTLALH